MWAGAALAAQLGPGLPFGAGLAEASQALRALPSNLSDPAAAWPPGAREALPGPVAYWTCQALVVGGLGAVAWLVWRVFRRRGERDGLGVERSAYFARRRDLRRLAVNGPVNGRIVLGRVGGQLVATETRTSICIVGPSQSFKTSGLCVPALLELGEGGGAAIVASVKGDIHSVTHQPPGLPGQGEGVRPHLCRGQQVGHVDAAAGGPHRHRRPVGGPGPDRRGRQGRPGERGLLDAVGQGAAVAAAVRGRPH